MSLKAFHVCFITLSAILAAGFGLWALRSLEPGSPTRVLAGIAGFAIAAGLVAYEGWFLRKMRHVSYL